MREIEKELKDLKEYNRLSYIGTDIGDVVVEVTELFLKHIILLQDKVENLEKQLGNKANKPMKFKS